MQYLFIQYNWTYYYYYVLIMIAIAIAISNTTFKASITSFVNKILIAGIMDEAVDLAGGGQVGDVVNPPSPAGKEAVR